MTENTAIQIIDALSEKLGIVIDYTVDNVVPYVEDLIARYIKYVNITSIFDLSLSVVFLLIPLIPTIIMIRHKTYKDETGYPSPAFIASLIFSIFAGCLFFFVFFNSAEKIILVNTVPEILILNLLSY